MRLWIAAMAMASVAATALAQPGAQMPGVTATYASSAIRLDGRLEEKAWLDATPVHLVTADGKPITGGAVVRFTWDKDYVYVGAEVPDDHIIASRANHDDPMWVKDDVLEIFLWPQESLPYYYEFVVNPRPSVYDAFCVAKPGHDGADLILPDWNPDVRVQARVQPMVYRPDKVGPVTPNGFWNVEMAIPISSLSSRGNDPLEAGESWRVQVVRFNRPDPAPGTLEASAFSPYYNVAAPYLLDRFGKLTFEGAAPVPVAPLVPGTGAAAKPSVAPTATPAPATPAAASSMALPPVAPAPASAPAAPAEAPAAKTVTVNVTGYTLRDAVALLFQGTGLNHMVLPVVASNTVTVSIADKPLEEALDVIVEAGNAKWHKDAATGVYMIEPKDAAPAPSTPPANG